MRGAFASRISVLTGGPGVGKTVCTRAIVAEAEAADATDRPLRPDRPRRPPARGSDRARGADDPPDARVDARAASPPSSPGHPLPAELVIVDESSMLNLRLVEVLLDGLAESTHIVFVGDADQLPPIGAGKPFEDLIASGVAPVVRLTQIFRQAARSMITTAAHEINSGRPPHLEPGEDQDHDFFFIDRPNPERALETVVEVVAERAPKRFGVDPIRDVQVLAPMYRGAVGIDALNERLQARLNPDGKRALERALPDRRPADPDPQLARARPDERLDRLPPRRRPRRGGDRRRHRRGRLAGDPLRRDRDPAPRLRDLGPQGAGLRGAGRGRRLPPLPLADADPARCSTPRSPGPAAAACWSATRPRWARRCAATTAAAATRAWPSACAAAPRAIAGDGGSRLGPALVEIAITLAGSRCSAGWCFAVPALRHAVSAAIHGDTAEVRQRDRQPRRRRAAADPRPGADPRGRLLPGRDRRRRRRLRLRLLPGPGADDVGWLLSGLLCYAIGRSVARPLLDRWLGAERFERTEAMIERGGVTLLIAVRLIPIVPFSLVSYAAGAARVPLWRFVWTTAVGYLPITALSVYFGTQLEGLSLTDPLVLGSAAALLALLLIGHWIVRRQAARPALASADPLHLEAEDRRRAVDVAGGVARASTRTAWRPAPKRRATAPGRSGRGRRRSGR